MGIFKTFGKRRWLGVLCCTIGLVMGLIWQSPTLAAPIKVATRVIPPFVMQENPQASPKAPLSGFSIDLWEKIAEETKQPYEFQVYATLPEVLNAVKTGKADAAIAAISITAEREKQFDFSYPMFSSGLRILVRHPKQGSTFLSTVSEIFSPALRQIILVALVMVFIAAHVVWLLERGHAETMISRRYWPGIFEAAWWAGATLATQADEMPRSVYGRLTAIVWMFTSVVFVAYFTATFTTVLTVQKLQGDIQGLKDLSGRVVATTASSTAADFLRSRRIKTLEVPKIEDAYQALLEKKSDAVVFDAPVLMYYAANEGDGKVLLVGNVFREENYGIVLPGTSPNRKAINAALLSLKEDGTYQALYDRWFKSNQE